MGSEAFIKLFSEFLKENCSYFYDLDRLEYVQNEYNQEYLYIVYRNNSQKRIDITGDSTYSIMVDFFDKIDRVPWVIKPEERI